MRVKDVIKELEKLPQEKEVHCQLVPVNPPGAWSMFYSFEDIPTMEVVQLRVWHPTFLKLPE